MQFAVKAYLGTSLMHPNATNAVARQRAHDTAVIPAKAGIQFFVTLVYQT